MTDAQRESVIKQIDLDLASTVTQEAEQKQRALEEAKKLVGAFPSLSGSPAPESSISPAATPVLPTSNSDKLEDEPDRIPPPPSDPLFSRILPTRDRPWENLVKGASTYIRKHSLHKLHRKAMSLQMRIKQHKKPSNQGGWSALST